MKFLLTSNWISNDSIKKALFELVWKKPEDTNIVFIPTASNNETGDKTWVIDNLISLKKLNPKAIQITDIQTVDKDFFMESFRRADVILFSWGDTYHLMRWVEKTWLRDELKELLKDKVYVWISAWSMITNPNLDLKLSYHLYTEERIETEKLNALNFVDFYFLPHLNSEIFPKIREENILKASKETSKVIYAIDDKSALKIIDDNIEVVSEWEYLIFNEE